MAEPGIWGRLWGRRELGTSTVCSKRRCSSSVRRPPVLIRFEGTPVPAMPVHVEVARQATTTLTAPQSSTHKEIVIFAIASAGLHIAGQLRLCRVEQCVINDGRYGDLCPVCSGHGTPAGLFVGIRLACNALVLAIVETSNVSSVAEDVIDRAYVPPTRPFTALGGQWHAPLSSASQQCASASTPGLYRG